MPKGTYVPSFANTGTAWSVGACSPDRILVVVENLERIGGFPEEDYIVCGLTEELVSQLSGYGENMIAVRAPAAASGNAAASVSSSAFKPCIVHKLRGNVRLHGDEIRVCVGLIELETGVVTWSQTFTYRLSSSSLFDIQEQVGRKLASTVLDPHRVLYRSLKRKPPAMLGTYLAVFRYHEYQEHFSSENHLRARHELENAVQREPDYAAAWAALANVCLGEALFGFNQTRPLKFLIGMCVETARRAIALDSRNVMANYILAMTLFNRKDKAQFLMMVEHALPPGTSPPG